MDYQPNENGNGATALADPPATDRGVTLRASNLHDLMSQAIAIDPSPEGATAIATGWLHEDQDLYESLTAPIIRDALLKHAYAVRGLIKSDVKSGANGNAAVLERLSVQGVKVGSFLQSWFMPDGDRSLSDYTGTELLPVAEQCKLEAKGKTQVAKFYAQLAGLAGDRRVGDAVKDKAAKEIWNKICGG